MTNKRRPICRSFKRLSKKLKSCRWNAIIKYRTWRTKGIGIRVKLTTGLNWIPFSKWISRSRDWKIKLRWSWMLFKDTLENQKISVPCWLKRWRASTQKRCRSLTVQVWASTKTAQAPILIKRHLRSGIKWRVSRNHQVWKLSTIGQKTFRDRGIQPWLLTLQARSSPPTVTSHKLPNN